MKDNKIIATPYQNEKREVVELDKLIAAIAFDATILLEQPNNPEQDVQN